MTGIYPLNRRVRSRKHSAKMADPNYCRQRRSLLAPVTSYRFLFIVPQLWIQRADRPCLATATLAFS